MVITPGFQPGEDGSIPFTRSSLRSSNSLFHSQHQFFSCLYTFPMVFLCHMRLLLSFLSFVGIMFLGFFVTGYLLLAQVSISLLVPPIALVVGVFVAYRLYTQGNFENGLTQNTAANQTRSFTHILFICILIALGALLIVAYFMEHPLLSFLIDRMYSLFGLN